MASGNVQMYVFSYVGVADDIEISLPFTPRVVQIAFDNGGLVSGFKTDQMSGDAYVSQLGTDAGVTIGDRKITIANGADVNQATVTGHGIAMQ